MQTRLRPVPPRLQAINSPLLGWDGANKYDIRAFGAVGDGKANDTGALQLAVNAAAVGGGVVYVPKGVYVVGKITFPATAFWTTILMDGNLYLTQTLEMNQRNYALIGRSGAMPNGFQQEPSTELFFDPSLNPVIHVTANPIYIEGLTFKYIHGDGILATDGAVDLVLKRVYIASTSDGTGSPLRVENSQYSFGLYVDESEFQAAQFPGAHSIVIKNYSIVSIQNTELNSGGIYMSAPDSPEASGYDFDHILYEGGYDPFLTIDNTHAYFTGISLDFVELADPYVTTYLIENSGTGHTDDVFLKFSRTPGTVVHGNSPIMGLFALPASTTVHGGLDLLGQDDYFSFFDNSGNSDFGRLAIGKGGTPITKDISVTVPLSFPSIGPRSQQEIVTNLPGANTGESCYTSPDTSVEPSLTWSCYISSKDAVTVRLVNASAAQVTPAQRNWRIDVWEH